MSECKFKVGDRVRAIDNTYAVTNRRNKWEGIITNVRYDGCFDARTENCTKSDKIGMLFERLVPRFFNCINNGLEDSVNNLAHYIINDGATILFWADGTKTIVKRTKEDEFNPRLAFLTAYFQKKSGLSKTKANKFLNELKIQEPKEKKTTKKTKTAAPKDETKKDTAEKEKKSREVREVRETEE